MKSKFQIRKEIESQLIDCETPFHCQSCKRVLQVHESSMCQACEVFYDDLDDLQDAIPQHNSYIDNSMRCATCCDVLAIYESIICDSCLLDENDASYNDSSSHYDSGYGIFEDMFNDDDFEPSDDLDDDIEEDDLDDLDDFNDILYP